MSGKLKKETVAGTRVDVLRQVGENPDIGLSGPTGNGNPMSNEAAKSLFEKFLATPACPLPPF
ncbi:MAG: hypothetical protein LBR80_00470 [Deltaproteobacteria bacterium]|jgi:hypothetical protein|nr:hypothetical protein [Deltaproteobacteria bacterium]